MWLFCFTCFKKWSSCYASHSGGITAILTLGSSRVSTFFLLTLVTFCIFDSSYPSGYYFGYIFNKLYFKTQQKGSVLSKGALSLKMEEQLF